MNLFHSPIIRLFHLPPLLWLGLLAVLLWFFLPGCITRVDIEPSDFEEHLVVEGFITDEFGPHEFRITRVARFAGVLEGGLIEREEAEVRIIDQNGVSTPLRVRDLQRKEVFNANPPACTPAVTFARVQTNYLSPGNFRGEIGNTYTLEIITGNGNTYRSTPQTMRATPPIQSLQLRFVELPSLDPVIVPSGVEISASWQDPPDEENYYSWRVNGIYRINTSEANLPGACCLFDPRDNQARDCWINETDLQGNEIAFSDAQVNGQLITKAIGFVEDDGLRFASNAVPFDKQYYIEIEQYAISKEAYDFNQRIRTLQDIDGEIFDPPPLGIRGNINNIDDPSEIVIGHFGAYAMQKRDIFIPANLLEFRQRFTSPCGDCRVRAGAQVEIPEPYR